MPLETSQIVASLLAVLVSGAACAAIVLGPRALRPAGTRVLAACAALALASFFRFGAQHELSVDTGSGGAGPGRGKVVRQLPLQFHEFFHYYLGARYFSELGYTGLYACAALADAELAAEQGAPPRIQGYVRDLASVLDDVPVSRAARACADGPRGRFSAARWEAFRGDLVELQRLVADDAWGDVVNDAGFNPPPGTVGIYALVASAIPIRAGPFPSFVLVTSLDLVLLALALAALRSAFGVTAAAVAAVAFGASFVANYGWIGGAFLRLLWVWALVSALWAMKRGRWALAGAALGLAASDRVFPVAFAVGAALPLVARASRDASARRALLRLSAGTLGTVVALGLAGAIAYGADAWPVFLARTLRYEGIYLVPHLGLKKLLTYRAWVPGQDFHGHAGLAVFRAWNARLRETWDGVRPLGLAMQVAGVLGVGLVAARRRPYEAAVLFGVAAMFLLAMPASYYYVVLFVVPALTLRVAATAPTPARKVRGAWALAASGAFWVATLVVPRLIEDDIVANVVHCAVFAGLLGVWTVAWALPRSPALTAPRPPRTPA